MGPAGAGGLGTWLKEQVSTGQVCLLHAQLADLGPKPLPRQGLQDGA